MAEMTKDQYVIEDEEQGLQGTNKKQVYNQEPQTHLDQRSFFERCPLQGCTEQRQKLTRDEIQSYYALKQQTDILYNSDDVLHEVILKDLWKICFMNDNQQNQDNGEIQQNKDSGYPPDLKSDQWMDIGFQRNDPRTDFRGGGLSSLKFLINFVAKEKEKWDEIVNYEKNGDGGFQASCSSIGCTFFLKQFFHQLDGTNVKRDRGKLVNRTGFKNFCRVLDSNADAFYEQNRQLQIDEFDIWKQARDKDPSLTLLDFGSAKKVCEDKCKLVFEKGGFLDTVDKLKKVWNSKKLDVNKVKKFDMNNPTSK